MPTHRCHPKHTQSYQSDASTMFDARQANGMIADKVFKEIEHNQQSVDKALCKIPFYTGMNTGRLRNSH